MNFTDDNTLSPLAQEDIYLDMQAWVSQFLENKEMHQLSPKSIKSYKDASESFLSFIKLYREDNVMENIGAKFINRYLIHYQALLSKQKLDKTKDNADEIAKYKRIIKIKDERFLGRNDMVFEVLSEFENTLHHRSNIVKMLLKYISENNSDGHDYQTCFHDIITISVKEKDTDFVTVDEMDSVIDMMSVWSTLYKTYKPKSTQRYAYRDSLMILLYALTGARSAEVVKIKLQDITPFTHYNKQYYRIKIKEAKGGHKREIGIQADFIKEHIEYFKQELPSDEYFLSSSCIKDIYTNKSQHPDTTRKFGNYVLKILGINKTGLHTFRRGYATKRVVNDKKSLAVVAKEIGNTAAVLERFYFKYNSEMGLDE